MMDPSTGDVTMLDTVDPNEAAQIAAAHDMLLVMGTDDQIAATSRAVKLGNRELANRKARRAQQKASRRANR